MTTEAGADVYRCGYEDGAEQERARIAKELGCLNDGERLSWVAGFLQGYHLTRECGCGCDPWPNGSCGDRAPVPFQLQERRTAERAWKP